MVSQADMVPALQGRGACSQDYPYGWGCGLLPPAIGNIELGCGMFWNESVMQPPHSWGGGGGSPEGLSEVVAAHQTGPLIFTSGLGEIL